MCPIVTESQETPEVELTRTTSNADYTKRIALGAILGALSIALSVTAAFIPRIPGWGIALFDPVSLIWIIAFLIGGIEVGMITTYAGFFGLFLFDPTGVGPIFKFLATVPMILVPWVAMNFSSKRIDGSHLSSLRSFSKYMVVAYIFRLGIMIPLNLLVVPLLFGISDVTFIVMYTLILNTLQSFWDAVIPFYIVHSTRLFENFRMW
ncbi:MAG: hypothetical protein P1Q69_04995 [Candidatus Thorarchaeota archaeon]|nr:hypothetical protein [Candidatus Thorarchaeota archaeon]